MKLLNGDCLEVLRTLPDDSLDSMVTDPPAGIAFMGKDWDKDKGGRDGWIAWMTEVMRECNRVLKPGAHALVWAIPRTSHWTMTALEDAGFEVRDVVTHLFGTGFPKSLDVSKAIDKAAGAERPVIGIHPNAASSLGNGINMDGGKAHETVPLTAPATPEAQRWQGYGTALKPACEFWVLCRKPLGEKTVAANVLKHGTGGLNIDGARIGVADDEPNKRRATGDNGGADSLFGVGNSTRPATLSQGRFPANLVLSHSEGCGDVCADDCAAKALDEQSGVLTSGSRKPGVRKGLGYHGAEGDGGPGLVGNIGGASRFFYVAKATKSDRNSGVKRGE